MYTDRLKTTVQRRTRMLNFKKSLSLKISRITTLEIHWASNLPALHFHVEKKLGFFGWDHLADKENGANTALWVCVNARKYLSWFGQYKPFSFVTAPLSMDELLHATSKFNKANHAMILVWLRSYWNAVSTSFMGRCTFRRKKVCRQAIQKIHFKQTADIQLFHNVFTKWYFPTFRVHIRIAATWRTAQFLPWQMCKKTDFATANIIEKTYWWHAVCQLGQWVSIFPSSLNVYIGQHSGRRPASPEFGNILCGFCSTFIINRWAKCRDCGNSRRFPLTAATRVLSPLPGIGSTQGGRCNRTHSMVFKCW